MRELLIASNGHVLTDGTVYGKMIFLADGADASAFREITYAEYEAIMSSDSEPPPGEATESDYQAALKEFGVNI